jgi:hypothetical protein
VFAVKQKRLLLLLLLLMMVERFVPDVMTVPCLAAF